MNMKVPLIIIASVVASAVTKVWIDSRWTGFFVVFIPLMAIYVWTEYRKMKAADEKRKIKHKNKYL